MRPQFFSQHCCRPPCIQMRSDQAMVVSKKEERRLSSPRAPTAFLKGKGMIYVSNYNFTRDLCFVEFHEFLDISGKKTRSKLQYALGKFCAECVKSLWVLLCSADWAHCTHEISGVISDGRCVKLGGILSLIPAFPVQDRSFYYFSIFPTVTVRFL